MEIGRVAMPGANALDQVAEAAFASTSRGKAASANAPAGHDFASLIQQSLAQVNTAQSQAESASHQFQLGQNDVTVEDATIAATKANISFQMTLQVRNKLVAAYNDIMNMQL